MSARKVAENGHFQHATFAESSQKTSRIGNMRSDPPKQLPITPSVRKVVNYRGPKSYSQAEIPIGSSDRLSSKIPPKLMAASTLASIDPEDPLDEFDFRGSDLAVSTKASDNSVKTAEQKNEEETQEEEEKAQVAHHHPIESKIGSVGEKTFTKGVHGINLSGLSRPRHAKVPPALTEKAKEKSKAALKVSKAPDPFEDKYAQPEGLLQEMISNVASPANPLYKLCFIKAKSNTLQKSYRHFVVSLFESMFLIRDKLLKYENEILVPEVHLERPKGLKSNKTLVLDLDETLVHCVEGEEKADIRLNIKLFDGFLISAGINIRPGVIEMLTQLSKIYEIIVFTSSDKSYANSILDYIDRNRNLIHHRLYRENCVEFSGNVYIKDLRVLGRDLKNTILVDNAPYAFGFQLENGYPIVPFYDCKEDEEIKKLSDYLLQIKNVEDIRVENRKRFRLKEMLEVDIGRFIQYYHSVGSDVSSSERSYETLRTDNEEDPVINSKIRSALNGYQRAMDQIYKQGN